MSDFARAAIKSMARHERKASDVYPTRDIRVTQLLLDTYPPPPGVRVWEPACGAGHISRVLFGRGYQVESSDIRRTGYGEPNRNFLTSVRKGRAILTNPPFNLAELFIRHALGPCEAPYLALLLKSNYWHSRRGVALYKDHPPTAELAVPWRVAFLKDERGNSPLMDVTWYIWEAGQPPCFLLKDRPTGPSDLEGSTLLVSLVQCDEAMQRLSETLDRLENRK